jgi:hypothetical protein
MSKPRRRSRHHAVAEARRADTQRQVEATPHVLQRDQVCQLHELGVVEVPAQLGDERVGHLHGCAAHADRVVEYELLDVGEQRAGPVGGQRQQLLVAQAAAARDLRAQVDAVFAVRERGGLQLGQHLEAVVDAVQPGRGLLQPGVAAQQPGHVRVHLDRLDHAFGLTAAEPRDLAAGEAVADPHERTGFAGGDPFDACHL